jgi:hypothetical protein
MGSLWCPIPHDSRAKTASKTFKINFVGTITVKKIQTVAGGCQNQTITQETTTTSQTNFGSVTLTAKGVRPQVNFSGNPIPVNGPFGPNDWIIINQQELNDKAKKAYNKAQEQLDKRIERITKDEKIISQRKIRCYRDGIDKCEKPIKVPYEATIIQTTETIAEGSIEGIVSGSCSGSYSP